MEVLPSINKLKISMYDIYEEYVKSYTKRELEKLNL